MALYIYGIIEEPQRRRFDFTGIEQAEVYTINYQALGAVVSDSGLKEVDPTRKNVLAHTIVQDKLMKECNYSMLPMGFGLIASTEGEVLGLMKDNYPMFTGKLEQFRGVIEVGVKVFWNQGAVSGELEKANHDFLRIREKLSKVSSPLEIQGLLLEAGRLVEEIARDWKAQFGRRIYDCIREMSIDAVMNEPAGIKNLLNASFLIERSREAEFQEEVRKLDAKYEGKLNFKCVCPLPPYSFVNLKLTPVKEHAG